MSTRKRASAQLSLIEFVRPVSEGFWPAPYSLEQAFELLRWMVATGASYRSPGRWVDEGVHRMLGVEQFGTIRLKSVAQLRESIHRGLLGREHNDAHRQWRADHGIRVDGTVVVQCRHNKPFTGAPYPGLTSEAGVRDAVDTFFGTPAGTRLKAQLNSVHRRARVVHRAEIHMDAEGFRFLLYYGFNAHRPGQSDSEWSYVLARSRAGETFLDTFARARSELDRAGTEAFVVSLEDKLAA